MTFNEFAIFLSIMKRVFSTSSSNGLARADAQSMNKKFIAIVKNHDFQQIIADGRGKFWVDVAGQAHKSTDELGSWYELMMSEPSAANQIIWEIDQAAVTDEPLGDKVVAKVASSKELLINDPQ